MRELCEPKATIDAVVQESLPGGNQLIIGGSHRVTGSNYGDHLFAVSDRCEIRQLRQSHVLSYVREEAGTQRYNVGTDTPKLFATSGGGVPLANSFRAA